jgi:chemotaxis protein histidine kinase CheA
MIKRRLFACYLLFGLGLILLIYSLNSMYMERYEVTTEGHIQNAFQVPDPFPKGKPDYRKKHEEEKKLEEQRLQEEERQRNEQQQKEEATIKKQEEETEAKKLKEAEEKANKEASIETENKAVEKEVVQTEAAKKPVVEEKKESSVKIIKELLNQSKAELTAEDLALPLSQRVSLRRQKYLAWMDEFNKLSDDDKKTVSTELQGRFLGMEHTELATFKEKIQYTDDEKVNGKVQPAGKKIIMLTATDGQGNSEIQDVLTMARENRAEYANYHGYTDYFVDLKKFAKPNRHPVWNKINAIKEAFNENPEAEWLWWIDTDIIIMNPEIDIAEHILSKRALTERLTYGRPMRDSNANFMNGVYMHKGEVDIDNIDLVLCQDFFGLNAGSFFIRRSAFTNLLLDLWDDPMYVKAEFVRREQDALIHMFLNHANIQEHVGLVPQRLLNSYSDNPEWVWSFVEGDFVIHFAGCNTRGRCNEIWKDNWSKRQRVPEAFRIKNSFDEKAATAVAVAPIASASATKAAL